MLKLLKESAGWDSSRVIDLVTYYLDRDNVPTNTLAQMIMKQMKKEGSKLPFNITDFYDALYAAIDDYNSDDSINESVGCDDLNSAELSAAEYALDLIANRPDMDVDEAVDEGCSTYNYAYLDYPEEDEANFPEVDSSKVRAYVKSKLNINESLINEKFLSSSETMDMQNLMFHTIDRVGKDVMIDYVNAMDRSLKAHTLKHSKFEETLATPYSYVERLPDGHNAYSYETQDGSILVTISGDMNREYQHRVYIVAYIETEDSEVTYAKHFTYYTQFDEAVMLANNIVFACEDKKSAEEIIKLCKSMGMERE